MTWTKECGNTATTADDLHWWIGSEHGASGAVDAERRLSGDVVDVVAAAASGARVAASAGASGMAAGSPGRQPYQFRRTPYQSAQMGQSVRRRRGGRRYVAGQRRQDRRFRRPRRPVGPFPRSTLQGSIRKFLFEIIKD